MVLLEESLNRRYLYRNVFASKLAMAWAYTARILAEYSAGKFSGASQVINVAYEVKIGPLVK